jgi:hypothetical protein
MFKDTAKGMTHNPLETLQWLMRTRTSRQNMEMGFTGFTALLE